MGTSTAERHSYATTEEIRRVFAAQKARASSLRTTEANERREKLDRLSAGLQDNRSRIKEAMRSDFNKAPVEVDLTEIMAVLDEISHARTNLDDWMAPKRVGTPFLFTGTRSEIHVEPKGVVLIISPWNYPVTLTLGPLVAAIAAGNCAIVKPSEYTPHTNTILESILAERFEEEEITLLRGAKEVAETLLSQPFDHIFFTGSTRVGRIVMKAAAEHPTSVTLELGGKSPAIVDDTADLTHAAERIAWSKFTNAGQTCIAPDYVLVKEPVHDAFVDRLVLTVDDFYGSTDMEQRESPDFARLIDDQHWQRTVTLLDDAVETGATVAAGGHSDAETNYVSPTILTSVSLESSIMQEEIFGPILPVLSVDTLEEALKIVNRRPNPLTLYIFSQQDSTVDTILDQTTAGSTCVNEAPLHFLNPALPFGGVGESGMGRGHGEAGFRTFSNQRSVLKRTFASRLLRTLYPPYDDFTEGLVDKIIRYFKR